MEKKKTTPKRPKQPKQQLFSNEFKIEKEFGGSLLNRSHAKKARPIAVKKTMHLTLKSSKARGIHSFRFDRNRIKKIEEVARRQAQRFGVEIFKYANVGNHLHLLVKASHRKGFISFLKSISGIIARIALGAEKGLAKVKKENKFWDQRPWTRILLTWTEFLNVRKYVEQNFKEAMGFIPYSSRNTRGFG